MNSLRTKKLSVIIPCFNEEQNILEVYEALSHVAQTLSGRIEFEYVFVNDGSADATHAKMMQLQSSDAAVLPISLSRNFGKEAATSCGLAYATGDCAIIVDADMQYPVDKIPEFVDKWEQGSDVVIGVRDQKQTSNIIEKIGSFVFYKIMYVIAPGSAQSGHLDFRLIDRRVIDEFNQLTEHRRMTRALIDWLGFTRSFVSYHEQPRARGEASYSLISRTKLALSAFVSHSLIPLKVAGYLGIIITATTSAILIIIAISRYGLAIEWGLSISRFMIVAIFVTFLSGINLICLGLIALYIENIQVEVTKRPLYIIKKPRL